MPKVSYSAILLDDESSDKLKKKFQKHLPENWKLICHHMTICLGELPPEYKHLLNSKAEIFTSELGASNDAMAVKVTTNLITKNKFPHITIAIPNDGKPVNSNYIEHWKRMIRFKLTGTIVEI